VAAQRRVTLRTAWVQDEEGKTGTRTNPGIKGGPNCPSCGVPLKRTSSGTMHCWFCEKEFDIDPCHYQQEKTTRKDEPEFGRPASDYFEDDDIETPDGRKEVLKDEDEFEMDLEEEEEEEEEEEKWSDLEEEKEEGEEFEIEEEEEEVESEEEEEEEDEEEFELEEEDEVEVESEEDEEEFELDEEEGDEDEAESEEEGEEYDLDMEEDEEVEEIADDEDVFDPMKWKKKRPHDLEDLDEEDFEVELDE